MKSIIEEASSISKAIEQAWKRSGKPREFKIKVFEEAQRNMFGLTSRSAKIAFIYNEQTQPEPTYEKAKRTQSEPFHQNPKREPKKRRKAGWTEELVKVVDSWIKECLHFIGLPNISFETNAVNNHLYITFSSAVIEDIQKERILFSSFAHLIMATLGNRFKRKFVNFKVILKSK